MPEKMIPVSAAGKKVPNLYQRGAAFYMLAVIGGKRYVRSIPSTCATTAERVKWIRAFRRAAEAGRVDALQESGARRELSSVGDVVRAYEVAAQRLGRPAAETVRRNVAALRGVLEAVGYSGVDGQSAGVLDADLPVRYATVVLRRRDDPSARRSVVSYLRQARSVTKPAMVAEYGQLRLPDLSGWMTRCATVAPRKANEPFIDAECAIIGKGAELRGVRNDLYVVWLLASKLALRAAEIAQARRSWIRRHEVTALDRAGAPWLADVASVWVLDLGGDPDARLKTAASAGVVPMADDVAGELLAYGGPGYLVGDRPATARANLVGREFPAWMRGAGWTREGEYAQALRQYRYQVWARTYGRLVAEAWVRHSIGGIQAYYDAPMYLSRPPLGLAQ